jgi:hypothetical protein
MPYVNEWKNKGLHRTFSGIITGKEVLISNINIQNDEKFNDIDYVLNDFTRIESFNISDFHVNKVSTIDNIAARSNDRLKIIIVANNEGFLKFVDMYLTQMEDSPFECVVFHDMESALNSIPG